MSKLKSYGNPALYFRRLQCIFTPPLFIQVPGESVNVETAYTLFYQRQNLVCEDFMPTVDGMAKSDTASMDDDYNNEYKKYCVLQ